MPGFPVPARRARSVSRTGLLCLILAATPGTAVRLASPRRGCPEPDSTAPWARVNRAWSREAGAGWTNDSLRRVLFALRDRDQAARTDFGSRVTDSVYGRRLIALDSALAAELAGILGREGLPTRAMVGAEGSDAAMLIVQHSWPLQERVLALAQAVPPGQISPQALAMLEDRVRTHQGKPQRYGTQFDLRPDGTFSLAPIADLQQLAALRAGAGLPPFALYLCMVEEAGMRIDRAALPPSLRP